MLPVDNRKKMGAVIFTIVFVGSVVANVFLVFVAVTLFEKLQLSRIFPLGYVRQDVTWERVLNAEETGKAKLFFLGDSRASMWEITLLKEEYDVVNLAHGGQTSSQVLLQVISASAPEDDWVILQVGINDIHSIGAFPELKRIIIENLKNNISQILDHLLSRGNRVILTNLFPPGSTSLNRMLFWDCESFKIIKEINDYIVKKSSEPLVYFLDSFELLRNLDGKLKKEYLDEDFFLHVNGKAYSMLNAEVIRLIKSVQGAHPK